MVSFLCSIIMLCKGARSPRDTDGERVETGVRRLHFGLSGRSPPSVALSSPAPALPTAASLPETVDFSKQKLLTFRQR